ncbi:bifunctional nuclease family protein [Myroides injenensis]|uniref:bifunctional nuclease family protein n=1 Tax=Myroides injenensis TaxID=1183151 RepID=UPI000474F5AB|nr:bifunctional nuclease family protein [Myroides injenensis]
MSLIKLMVKGISYSHTQNGAYALILDEVDGERKLPIVIGAFEAQSIAIAIEEEIRPPRPLTHDLFKSFADRYDIKIKQVIIHKLVDGVFFSSLVCERMGVEEILDARTSDAIALAIRFDAPIFVYKDIMNIAGITLNSSMLEDLEEDVEEDESDDNEDIMSQVEQLLGDDYESPGEDYLDYDIEELNTMLDDAIAKEDYEKAAKLRDELNKRQ